MLLSYGDRAGHAGPIISSDFRDNGSELIDHSKATQSQPQSLLSSALLSYSDGAGHDGPCAAKSTDFRNERSELIVWCEDECCAAVAMDNEGGGTGLIDNCEDVTLPPSHPPSTLLMLLQSCGGLNDLCNDVMEHGDGGPGLIDHCDKISLSPPPSSSLAT